MEIWSGVTGFTQRCVIIRQQKVTMVAFGVVALPVGNQVANANSQLWASTCVHVWEPHFDV